MTTTWTSATAVMSTSATRSTARRPTPPAIAVSLRRRSLHARSAVLPGWPRRDERSCSRWPGQTGLLALELADLDRRLADEGLRVDADHRELAVRNGPKVVVADLDARVLRDPGVRPDGDRHDHRVALDANFDDARGPRH